MERSKGVTLVELVIAVATLGIIAALAIPSLSSLYARYSLRSAARKVAIHLELAKMKAISKNLEYRVEFVGNTFRVTRGNKASDSTSWTSETDYLALPNGITIVSNTLLQSKAEFNTDSTCDSGSVTLQNSSGEQYKISLTSSTGRIKMEKL